MSPRGTPVCRVTPPRCRSCRQRKENTMREFRWSWVAEAVQVHAAPRVDEFGVVACPHVLDGFAFVVSWRGGCVGIGVGFRTAFDFTPFL